MLSYVYEVLTLVAIFAIGSLGLALIVSQAGMLSLAHGASIGLGAYAFSLLAVTAGWPPAAALLAAIVILGLSGGVIAYFSCELDEEQFAVTTLAINILIVNILINWTGLTQGSYGISQIPRLTIFAFGATRIEFLVLCSVAAVVSYAFMQRLAVSEFGTLLRASAVQKDVVEALGASVLSLRVKAVTAGSAAAGLAGALFAMHSGYIAPQLFELHLSILLLAMVVVGGGISMAGAVFGAAILVLIPEVLRFAASSAASAGPLRQIVFGSLLLAVIFFQAHRRSRRAMSDKS